VEESIRMTEDRYKWRKYVHGVANPRIEDGWRTVCMYTLVRRSKQYIQAQQTAVNTVHQTYNCDQVRWPTRQKRWFRIYSSQALSLTPTLRNWTWCSKTIRAQNSRNDVARTCMCGFISFHDTAWFTLHSTISTAPVSANISHTYIHLFNGPSSGTTRVSRYQVGKTQKLKPGLVAFYDIRPRNRAGLFPK